MQLPNLVFGFSSCHSDYEYSYCSNCINFLLSLSLNAIMNSSFAAAPPGLPLQCSLPPVNVDLMVESYFVSDSHPRIYMCMNAGMFYRNL